MYINAHSPCLCQCSSRYACGLSRMFVPAIATEDGSWSVFCDRAHPAPARPWRLWLRPNGHLALLTSPMSEDGGAYTSLFKRS
jgi:hypothetical protein